MLLTLPGHGSFCSHSLTLIQFWSLITFVLIMMIMETRTIKCLSGRALTPAGPTSLADVGTVTEGKFSVVDVV